MAVVLDLVARVPRLVIHQELARQIVDQLADLALLPNILPLKGVDGESGCVQQFPDCAGMGVDGLNGLVGVAVHARTWLQ